MRGFRAFIGILVLLPFAASSSAQPVRFGVPPWQGAEAKTAVVTEALQAAGFDTDVTEASPGPVFEAMANGRLEANLSAWEPGQEEAFRPLVQSGALEVLGTNLEGAETGLAVPEAAHRAGLRSMSDLTAYRDELEATVHCIEPGSGANNVVHEAREHNLYGLGSWDVVASSTQAMLAQVERVVDREGWIVFCAWRPHWMNVAFDLEYLADPKGHWGRGEGGAQVYTVVRRDLADDAPGVVRFLRRFNVSAATQSRWIHAYAREERSLDTVARDWLVANQERVRDWFQGVESPEGGSAGQRFAATVAQW